MSEFVTDKSFDLERIYEYILSIQVSLGGFSFFVSEPSGKKLLAYKSTSLKISNENVIARHFKEWANSEELLQKPFAKHQIFYFTDKFTTVPGYYYSKHQKDEITQLVFEEQDDSEIAATKVKTLDIHLLFAVSEELKTVFANKFGEYELIHPLKNILRKLPSVEKENGLVLLFDVDKFYLALYNKQQLLLVNSFKVLHANDVVYYLLTALKQLNIQPQGTQLFLAGEIFQELETKVLLKRYFGAINFWKPEDGAQHNCNILKEPFFKFPVLF